MIQTEKTLIEFQDKIVVKTFMERHKEGFKSPDEIFDSELRAYQYFNRIDWKWAPRLTGYDPAERRLSLKRINGMSLAKAISEEWGFNIRFVIDQLIELDRSLWKNRINCLNMTVQDIMVEEETSRVYMVDYEDTYLHSRYKKILYHQMLSPKLFRIKDNRTKSEFISALRENRHRFHKYYQRWAYILCLYGIRHFILQKRGFDVVR